MLEHQRIGYATPQGKNSFLLASQPRGGAPLTLGYYMQPLVGRNPNIALSDEENNMRSLLLVR